jgi:hypothetical protein
VIEVKVCINNIDIYDVGTSHVTQANSGLLGVHTNRIAPIQIHLISVLLIGNHTEKIYLSWLSPSAKEKFDALRDLELRQEVRS